MWYCKLWCHWHCYHTFSYKFVGQLSLVLFLWCQLINMCPPKCPSNTLGGSQVKCRHACQMVIMLWGSVSKMNLTRDLGLGPECSSNYWRSIGRGAEDTESRCQMVEDGRIIWRSPQHVLYCTVLYTMDVGYCLWPHLSLDFQIHYTKFILYIYTFTSNLRFLKGRLDGQIYNRAFSNIYPSDY